jgi:hypothetical protein
MAKDLILTKESSESEIKAYFDAVLKLSQLDNEFPINFNEVWMLVYQDKRSAIFELKDKFIQDVDFQTVRRKVEASNVAGYVWADDYYLTISCMEFFIARKVRPVFEVYRQVFHKVAKHELSRKELALMVIQAEEEKERLVLENEQNKQMVIEKTIQLDESMEWYSIKRWAQEHNMDWRKINWRKLKALSYELGYKIQKVFDANYGLVNIYHKNVFLAYMS